MEAVTKQKCYEDMYLLRNKDGEREAWHYLLVSYDKISVIKDFERGRKVDLSNCCRYIEYRNEQGVVKRASGFGTDPPVHLVEWVYQNYGEEIFLFLYI
jgi:hypothetical protein